ncbi:hypothetical protein SNE40_001736 [Patella caerulea]|uniref:Integrase core domain-containing protein n=1 Tax=Patella caerulea TaxID=87958 RepID=A0AAN8Q6M9_PATCE
MDACVTAKSVFFSVFLVLCVVPRFCEGVNLVDCANNYVDRNDAIAKYFYMGFTYSEIISFLYVFNGVNIGYRQFQKILRKLGLRRNNFQRQLVYNEVIRAVEQELSKTGQNFGYRTMQLRLKQKYHISISRHSLGRIMRHLDPEGVQRRLRRRLHRRQYQSNGPNNLWHIDGWDKLKQFGMCIHGCIDGYSRRVLWLEASATNNDPYVICRYFSKCVRALGGVPKTIRADRGTENVNVEDMQCILRHLQEENPVSFIYGKSTGNQRIESWWSKLGLYGMTSWISHFKNLSNYGIIDTSKELDIQCILFCYIHLLHDELNEIVRLWNAHYIRKSTNPDQPNGRPDVLYYLSDQFGGIECLRPVCAEDLNNLSHHLTRDIPYTKESYRELFCIVMDDAGMSLPSSLEEAADLLVFLLDTVQNDINNLDE